MSDMLSKVEDIAASIGVAESTIRKYSQMFEKGGYLFTRNNQNALLYNENEVAMFKELLRLNKVEKMPLEKAINEVLLTMTDTLTNITDTSPNTSDMSKNIEDMLKTMSDMQETISTILKQNAEVMEQNKILTNKLNVLESSEKNKVGERDRILMESIREQQETKKLIMEWTAQNELLMKEIAAAKEENKKGFFSRLFGK